MRSESQIRQRLKQAIFRRRKKWVADRLRKRPENCQHNARVHLSVHQTVGVCMYKDESGTWNNRVCDVNFGGEAMASKCPYFSCAHTADSLKTEYRNMFGMGDSPMDVTTLSREFPDIMALMWVLDSSSEEEDTTDTLEEDAESPNSESTVSQGPSPLPPNPVAG